MSLNSVWDKQSAARRATFNDSGEGALRLITFGMPPVSAVEITIDFGIDAGRTDTDHMAVTIESYRLHSWQQIPIVEIRP